MAGNVLLTPGEPCPAYAMGVRNVLSKPLTRWQVEGHALVYGTDGVIARPFAGLKPRIEAWDEAGQVTADAINTVLEWTWGND